jgi:hypothetical protein
MPDGTAYQDVVVQPDQTLRRHASRRNLTFNDAMFRLQTTATVGVAKMYLGRSFINLKLNEQQDLLSLSPFCADQQTKYILAQNDVVQFTVAALGSTEFVESYPTATNLVLFNQHFDELKPVLI